MPNEIYRFLRASNLERIRSILIDSKLYFSKPVDLDDPFEFRPKNIVLKKYKRVTAANPKWEAATRTGMLKGLDNLTEKRTQSLSNLGVCCFSEAIDDTLMWAYYAEGHKGIAIKFDARHPYFKKLCQVTYQNERENVGIKSWQMPQIIQKVILVKDTKWEYQKEWRLINESGGITVEFPENAISSIIFGAKCGEDTISEVKNMVKLQNINYLKASTSKYSYNINIEACIV